MFIPNLSEGDFQNRLLDTFPRPWNSSEARTPKGNLHSLFISTYAQPDAFILQGVLYAQACTRIKTASNSALDTISNDFFGDSFPRLFGESDDAFRQRILDRLLQPKVTREAIQAAVAYITGYVPRMIEPWNPNDTAAWDEISFWDVDDVTCPFVWGDPALHFQGFIIVQIPLWSVTGGQPVWCLDAGWAWDSNRSFWANAAIVENAIIEALVHQTISDYKAAGTIIWEKDFPPAVKIVTGSVLISRGQSSGRQAGVSQLPYLSGGLGAIFVELCPYQSIVSVDDTNINFQANISIETPTVLGLSWMAISLLDPHVLHIEITPGAVSIDIPVDLGLGESFIISPSWNTTYWTAYTPPFGPTPGIITINFGTPSPSGHVDVLMYEPAIGRQSGTTNVGTGDTGLVVPFGSTIPYGFFATPTWDTTIALLQKRNNGVTLGFDTPAPAGGKIFWTVQEAL